MLESLVANLPAGPTRSACLGCSSCHFCLVKYPGHLSTDRNKEPLTVTGDLYLAIIIHIPLGVALNPARIPRHFHLFVEIWGKLSTAKSHDWSPLSAQKKNGIPFCWGASAFLVYEVKDDLSLRRTPFLWAIRPYNKLQYYIISPWFSRTRIPLYNLWFKHCIHPDPRLGNSDIFGLRGKCKIFTLLRVIPRDMILS